MELDTSDEEYRNALQLEEAAWNNEDASITRDLQLDEAIKLADRYSVVFACVVRSRRSDEALGCVTISVGDWPDHTPINKNLMINETHQLATLLADLLEV